MSLKRLSGGADFISAITSEDGGPVIERRVDKFALPGNLRNRSPDDPDRLAEFKRLFQQQFESRWPLAFLQSIGDPNGTTDPARESEFWDGTDYVARERIIEDVFWDAASGRMLVRLRYPGS